MTEWVPGECGVSTCVDEDAINPGVICPGVYEPVCGCDGVTYGNECEAVNYGGVTDYEFGECSSSMCVDEDAINPGVLCPAIFDPVCGCDGITYVNECEAINYGGVTEWTPGECGTETCIDESLIDPNAICPTVAIPVCGCDGVTYNNDCEAQNYGGLTSWTPGPCEPSVCIDASLINPDFECMDLYVPVCGCDNVSYINPCRAETLAGVTDFQTGSCVGQEPSALEDSGALLAGTAIDMEVLANDLYHDEVFVNLLEQPANGNVVINPDNTLTYTANEGFEGQDGFSYEWCYLLVDYCQEATVFVEVSTPQIEITLADDEAMVEGTEPVLVDVLINDLYTSEVPVSEELTISAQPASGTAEVTPDGQIQYTPEPGFVGEVTLEYMLCLSNICETAVLTLTVDASAESTERPLSDLIQIFPNPVESMLEINISGSNPMLQVQVFDLMGRLVWAEETSASPAYQKQLDLSQLSAGMYLLEVNLKDQLVVQKIQVKR